VEGLMPEQGIEWNAESSLRITPSLQMTIAVRFHF
jgi:hypothetical protein